MRFLQDGTPVYTATDLCDYLACGHLVTLKRRVAAGEQIPRDQSALSEVLANLGAGHEQHHLEALMARGLRIKAFEDGRDRNASSAADLRALEAETVDAMRDGYDVIYQPTFFDGRWLGRADFLMRVKTPSAWWGYSYEAADAKLARRVRSEALLQLCEYSAHLERLQGTAPRSMHVILGDRTEHSYRLDEFSAYHATVKRDFDVALLEGLDETYPDPVEHCNTCGFAARCAAQRKHDDHLSQVARMRSSQVQALQLAGIGTMTALAVASTDTDPPGRMQAETFKSLRAQAVLQHQGSNPDGAPRYELLDAWEVGHGLCALPRPSAGDLFFDMEGDGLARDVPLEYLFGAVDMDGTYHPWWGHDDAGEKRAFEQFVDFAIARLERHPDMHIYHYAAYEKTALRRLMSRHGTREEEVDRLLRNEVLVDLYRVVRQGIRLSTDSYSLKKVERLYMPARAESIADAAGSMVMYERWLTSREDGGGGDGSLLDEIALYNERDCASTVQLRAWLEARRAEEERLRGAPVERPEAMDRGAPEAVHEKVVDTQEVAVALVAGVPVVAEQRTATEQATWLLAPVLSYHRRENKVGWWRHFDQLSMTDEELERDTYALGPLEQIGSRDDGRRVIERFSFEPQEHRIGKDDSPLNPRARNDKGYAASAGEVTDLDSARGEITLSRTPSQMAWGPPRFLIPTTPIQTDVQEESLLDLARWVVANGVDAPGPRRAGRDLLMRLPPRLSTPHDGELRLAGEAAPATAVRLILDLNAGCLPIQGPPGAGKTHTAAEAILALLDHGRGPIGITALSHSAIRTLMGKIEELAPALGRMPRMIHQRSSTAGTDAIRMARSPLDVEKALADDAVDIVGGTSWLFSRPVLEGMFDTLVVDEAGQLSLSDALAVSRAARNLVLVGDPQQLAQPLQGSHPPGVGVSALEHLLGGDATIAPDRGVLLDLTWRMHPDVSAFISRSFYESRLGSEPQCARQAVLQDGVAMTGLRHAFVEHAGDRVRSDEEAQRVREIIEHLTRGTWRSDRGEERRLTLDDIVVVAPYNAHVACLVAALPPGARVGTVDRFQGQEAAVSIFSMATSSVEDLPRNLEFLFSLNRLNVAVSRARALSILVCSPELLRARCHTPEQMRLVNALCRFVAMAEPWAATTPNVVMLTA
ncbi:MAG: TM0106 family RecB-like putative nuclease [Candidatus Dormiibacterota bacterium]